jgi:hypothetical protein
MIPSIIEVVSYNSIMHMILLYDTTHYGQPKASHSDSILISIIQLRPKKMLPYHLIFKKERED